MRLTVELKDDADATLIQKVLMQIKGIENVIVTDNVLPTIETDDNFSRVMEQSENDYKEGRIQHLDDDLLNDLFNAK